MKIKDLISPDGVGLGVLNALADFKAFQKATSLKILD